MSRNIFLDPQWISPAYVSGKYQGSKGLLGSRLIDHAYTVLRVHEWAGLDGVEGGLAVRTYLTKSEMPPLPGISVFPLPSLLRTQLYGDNPLGLCLLLVVSDCTPESEELANIIGRDFPLRDAHCAVPIALHDKLTIVVDNKYDTYLAWKK